MYRFVRFVLYWFLRVYYGLKVSGREHLPAEGGYILAVNHQSFLDPVILGSPVRRFVCFMARTTLWRSRFFRCVDSLLGNIIPVKRDYPDKNALREAVRRLGDGWVILMFPEGTRTLTGRLGSVKKGPAFLADRVDAPIVPGILKGAYEIWPKGRRFPRLLGWPFRRLQMRYGPPIELAPFRSFARRERLERITAALADRMQELFDEE